MRASILVSPASKIVLDVTEHAALGEWVRLTVTVYDSANQPFDSSELRLMKLRFEKNDAILETRPRADDTFEIRVASARWTSRPCRAARRACVLGVQVIEVFRCASSRAWSAGAGATVTLRVDGGPSRRRLAVRVRLVGRGRGEGHGARRPNRAARHVAPTVNCPRRRGGSSPTRSMSSRHARVVEAAPRPSGRA